MISDLSIDLHMHSTVSDGTDSPACILEKVKELGLTHFSLTDHDATEGCATIKNLLGKGDPKFIFGAEFSCEDEYGKYHILGYGYDPTSSSIIDLVESSHSFRINKVTKRLDFIEEEFGFSFSQEDRLSLFSLENPGKPHIANMMVKYGYAPTKEIAIEKYLNKYKGEEKRISPDIAIKAILNADGIPVLAHPSYGSGDELIVGEEMEKRLQRLISFGLKGVEAFYSGFSRTLQQGMLDLAEKYGLYVTAGSDYHGTNKLVRLGDNNIKSVDEYPDGLLRFIRDVRKY